ncbi:protease SohB [Halorhodospira halophila]|uniref:Inner membrane peptidase, Serine peptidase, MEROPS family S49 n=1 Tax=Halorhodospira halophila (strain DSM 244 / SL1) TaxID=349124 RepID=A1WT84_HALHL|nr:protease SohB [Halorhodospira halophila]ABM60896.1 inner membrane peptidase, Serine peptidase, MEROPS family S49 [Halorhodospira halophila SL1]MBK1728553.1 protease SohB [Halorhodospira halophila]
MLNEYLLFLAQTATVVLAILLVLTAVVRLRQEGGSAPGRLQVRPLNGVYRQRAQALRRAGEQASWRGRVRKTLRRQASETPPAELPDKRIYVLEFRGDIRARAVEGLREEITAVIAAARPGQDEVILRLESPGGGVPAYGLAASQLARLREAGIHLTVCVDRVAASGGYLMAVVGDRIVAAPFALIGSIGVVGSLPNFHRWLRNRDIDFEQHTAGPYKRTLTVFGENTEADRERFREDLGHIHEQFKGFLRRYRPQLDVETVATGEFWLAERALEAGLIDALQTSDDCIMAQREQAHLLEVDYRQREGWSQRLTQVTERLLGQRSGIDRLGPDLE